jgi:hypothetical protein
LRDGFHNERLKESSEARKRNLTLDRALGTKTRHGWEIGEANTTNGLSWTNWMRVLVM